MLKKLSVLIVFITTTMTGCKTMRFGDVLPETRGTPLGNVVLGEENADFFVFGENEAAEPFSPGADAAKTVVVFKTRERHPVRRAARTVGTPVRVVKTAVYTVVGKIAGLLTFWKPKKDKKPAPEAPVPDRTPAPAPVAAPGYVPAALVLGREKEPSALPPAFPAESEWAESVEETASPEDSTEILHWAGPIQPALYGQNVRANQTGG
jgi:hypothetical protein